MNETKWSPNAGAISMGAFYCVAVIAFLLFQADRVAVCLAFGALLFALLTITAAIQSRR